jgi:hypothetical protein
MWIHQRKGCGPARLRCSLHHLEANPSRQEPTAGRSLRVSRVSSPPHSLSLLLRLGWRWEPGHIHLSIDGSLASMTYGTTRRIVIADLAPSHRVLEAEFVATDHGPFDPPVRASVTFVKQG